MATITFSNNINISAQVGDILFYHTFANDPGTELGAITAIGPNFVEVDNSNANINNIAVGNFFSFKKSSGTNYYANSSVKGYYAKVRISNNNSTKQELFYLGSEITESSK